MRWVGEESNAMMVCYPHCDAEMNEASQGARIEKGNGAKIDHDPLHTLGRTKHCRHGFAHGKIEFSLEHYRWWALFHAPSIGARVPLVCAVLDNDESVSSVVRFSDIGGLDGLGENDLVRKLVRPIGKCDTASAFWRRSGKPTLFYALHRPDRESRRTDAEQRDSTRTTFPRDPSGSGS